MVYIYNHSNLLSIMRQLVLFLLIGFSACSQQPEKKKYSIDPRARQFNDSAISITMYSQDYKSAIQLLDEAIKIDSNYYIAFVNKLSFQVELNQFDKALETAKELHRIKPAAPDNFSLIGMLYEKIGDTLLSKQYFKDAGAQFNKILDTMNVKNKYYEILLMNKAVNLIFMGDQQKGNDMLKQLYNKTNDEAYREMLASLINKSRQEILDNFTQVQQ